MDSELIDLSDRQRSIVERTLAPLGDRITDVRVFGSRALGRARPASDIDLAVYGRVDERDVAALWTAFDESELAVRVDVVAYDHLESSALKRHIDLVGKSLNTPS